MLVKVGFFIWLAIMLSAFGSFDRLLFLQYTFHRRNWERAGKPHGFFWFPREIKRTEYWRFIGRSNAHKRVRFNWLFVTPSWVRGNLEARFWLYAWRVSSIASVGFVLTPVLIDILW